jgi:hypothetical protein
LEEVDDQTPPMVFKRAGILRLKAELDKVLKSYEWEERDVTLI